MTTVAASTSQATITSANGSRTVLMVSNSSASRLYMSTVNGFSKANAPIVLESMQQWTLPYPYTGALYGVWDVAVGQAIVEDT